MYTLTQPIYTPDARKLTNVWQRRPPFLKSQAIQLMYERALRGVAREVGKFIRGYEPTDILSAERLGRALTSYSDLIGPWALTTVRNILTKVDKKDYDDWQEHSARMSAALRQELTQAPTGETLARLLDENVQLIKSIPVQAAQRVKKLIAENIFQSQRAKDIAQKIMETEGVTVSRATLIARTEISKAATSLTQSRANYIGSPGYIWNTSRDSIVRKSHRLMEGKFVEWNNPPTLDKMIGHAGQFPNCRCWPSPVIK